jgi:Zn-dependent peptidase ImmA (M78 family)
VLIRGFKSWCENVSIQLRKDLGLKPVDPLDVKTLADWLGIEIWTPHQIPGLEAKWAHILLKKDPDSWSAVTLSIGSKDLIILNSSHSKARQASDLTHELSHILIGHEAGRVDISPDGFLMLNTYNRDQEEEANWMAGCLLLPREALAVIIKQQVDFEITAKKYGVSREMVRWRINVTGVQRQFGRGGKRIPARFMQ